MKRLLIAAILLAPTVALADGPHYFLSEPSLAAANTRNAAYCAAVNCTPPTIYWWPEHTLADGTALIEVWQGGQYGYPTTVTGGAADLTATEKSSLLSTAAVTPTFTQMGTQTVAKQSPDTVTVTPFVGYAGDAITYTATLANGNSLPGWLAFSNGVFTGTPPAAGTFSVTVTGEDVAIGTAATESFSITAQ
jgi:hypothetical protein